MDDFEESTKSDVNLYSEIDFDGLYRAIEAKGPLRLSREGDPYKVIIEIRPCMCFDEGCNELLVCIWRLNGMFTMHWIISKDSFLQFESLDQFKQHVLMGGLIDSRGERMLIEYEAQSEFGLHYSKVEPFVCFCDGCMQEVGEEVLWRKMLVSQLSLALQGRDEISVQANDDFGSDGEMLAATAFDLGFSAGRIFSEFKVKNFIEPYALEGKQQEGLKRTRAKAAGQKPASMRTNRVASLLKHMELLAGLNPALLRVDVSILARLSCEEATKEDPSLWSQGRGQLDEYIGEMRRGEQGPEVRRRYLELFPSR